MGENIPSGHDEGEQIVTISADPALPWRITASAALVRA